MCALVPTCVCHGTSGDGLNPFVSGCIFFVVFFLETITLLEKKRTFDVTFELPSSPPYLSDSY